jgi:twitching motility protein PilT
MTLVPALLQAIVRVDGEALVMHAGDKPYVVSPTGQVELANRGLTLAAINGIVNQMLPPEIQLALDDFGAIQYELPAMPEFPGEHFTVVAARGGDDLWAEIRRHRVDDDVAPEEIFGPPVAEPVQPQAVEQPAAPAWEPRPIPPVAQVPLTSEITEADLATSLDDDDDVKLPDPSKLWKARPAQPLEEEGEEIEIDLDVDIAEEVEEAPPAVAAQPAADVPPVPAVVVPAALIAAPIDELLPAVAMEMPQVEEPVEVVAPVAEEQPEVEQIAEPVAEPVAEPIAEPVEEPLPIAAEMPQAEKAVPDAMAEVQPAVVVAERRRPTKSRLWKAMQRRRAAAWPPPSTDTTLESESRPPPSTPQPGVVLSIARSPIRGDQPPAYVPDPTLSGLERLLRLSAARGAQTLYLFSGSRPSVRVDGELQVLDGETVHAARDVEALLLTLMPARHHEALGTGAATEWFTDIDGLGRVRCMSFRDHLGPGGVFRMMPTRSISAEQLSLPRQVQALATEPEGIVLVAGPRSGGKRTLMAAFVGMMNRARRDHIISIEREINIVHERGHSFISQREVRGSDDELLTAARAAMREDPDVLVIEDLRTAALVDVALEAAASGRLVVAGFSAHNATAAVDRIIDLYSPEERRRVQFALANSLRGVVVQALLRKIGGGRLPAREVLLNTPAVSNVIAEGKTSQLPMAIEGGRRYGMVPLNDTLVGLVQTGSVEAREAYRRSPDRPGFLAALNRQGLDTSFVERLA